MSATLSHSKSKAQKYGSRTPEKKVIEDRSPVLIEANDFAVNDCILDLQVFSDCIGKARKPKDVAIP